MRHYKKITLTDIKNVMQSYALDIDQKIYICKQMLTHPNLLDPVTRGRIETFLKINGVSYD